MKLDTQARLTFDSVQFDKDTDAHLVVSLKAPKIDWQAKRPRVCIIPVIDISPSMMGQKLEYAKQSVLKLIDHLQPGDFCGVVAFGGEVFTVSKPVEVTQARKDELKAKVGQLGTNGSTNFSGGMCQGLELLNKGDLPDGMLKRVIMFTDGMPNTGIAIKKEDIVRLLEAQLGIATLSAFGYGTDADQELLADVAKTGKGNYAFIRNPEDALSAFAKELGGLLSTFAQNLSIVVAPHNGHTITATVSDVTAEEDGKKVKVTLPDILSEEERHLVFAVKLDKQPNAFPRESSVFDVTIEYDMLDGAAQKTHQTEELKAKVQFVKEDDAQKKPTPEVDRIVGLAQLVQAQVEAEEHAKRGDYAGAVKVMRVTCDSFMTRDQADLAHVSSNVAEKMGNQAVYAVSSGYLGSMRSAGSRAYGTSSLDASAAADLGAVGVSLSNSAQAQTVASFGGDAPAPVGAGVVGMSGMGGGGGVWAGGVVQPSVTGLPGVQFFPVPGAAMPVPNVIVNPSINVAPPAPAPKVKPKSKVAKSKSKRW
jgi:Ca-activated chloride channel family protein